MTDATKLHDTVTAVRHHIAALGVCLEYLTDEEVVDGVNRMTTALAASGVTAKQALLALTPPREEETRD